MLTTALFQESNEKPDSTKKKTDFRTKKSEVLSCKVVSCPYIYGEAGLVPTGHPATRMYTTFKTSDDATHLWSNYWCCEMQRFHDFSSDKELPAHCILKYCNEVAVTIFFY